MRPETDQTYGGVPPVAVNAKEYALPTMPGGSGEVEVIVNFCTCPNAAPVTSRTAATPRRRFMDELESWSRWL